MIHLSGTFAYQRYVNESRPGVFQIQPAAFYIAMMMRNDDGTPTFPNDSDVGDIGAQVIMDRPQQLGGTGWQLNLTLDKILSGYLGFTAYLEEVPPSFPFSWLPLAILIWVGGTPVGVLTAAPYPLADIGVAPTEPLGSTGAEA